MLRVQPSDWLMCKVYSYISGLIINLNAQIQLADGRVVWVEPQAGLKCIAPGEVETWVGPDINPINYEGELLGVTAYIHSSSPPTTEKLGSAYAIICLKHSQSQTILLAKGNLSSYNDVSWTIGGATMQPHAGYVKAVVGTDPAAGVEISDTVPTGKLWRLMSIRTTLVTDATAANRYIILVIADPTPANQWSCKIAPVHTASLTRYYRWMVADSSETAFDTTNSVRIVLADNLDLPAGWIIKTASTSLQAGDNFGAPYITVKEFLTI